jgi:hypothetical protein
MKGWSSGNWQDRIEVFDKEKERERKRERERERKTIHLPLILLMSRIG